MITPDDILTIASRASASVYRRWPDVIPWDDWDWQDARQAAAEGVVRALWRYAVTHPGYLYVAAKQAATRWLWRERLGRSPRETVQLSPLITDAEVAAPVSWLTGRKRAALLTALRKRKRNPEREAATDLTILELLLAGVPHHGIADLVGLTPNALRMRRQRIRARLRRYLEQEGCDENMC